MEEPGDGTSYFLFPRGFTRVVSVLVLPVAPRPPTLPSPPKPNSPPVPWTPVPSWVFEPRFPYMLSHLGLFTFLAYLKQLIDMRGTHNLQG